MSQNIFGLYKSIMQHEKDAIDSIESLDDAKQIIKMMMLQIDQYNGILYQCGKAFVNMRNS